MNRSGQFRILGIIMALVVGIIFFIFFAPAMAVSGDMAISTGQLSGFEAFLLSGSSLILWTLIFFFITAIVLIFFGGDG